MCDPFGDAGLQVEEGGAAGLRPAVTDVSPLWGVGKLKQLDGVFGAGAA